MRKTEQIVSWVVYRRTIHKQQVGSVAICEQSEWDEMELASPGYHTLIREGIPSETEAENLARIQPGVTPERTPRLQSRA